MMERNEGTMLFRFILFLLLRLDFSLIMARKFTEGGLYFCGTSNEDDDLSSYYYYEHDRRSDASSLLSSTVTARIVDGSADVTLVQNFRTPEISTNDKEEHQPNIAFYWLPLPNGATATAFSAKSRILGTTIRGMVQSREDAEAAFEQALQDGEFVGIAEQRRRYRPETLQVGLGHLLPKDDVHVTVTYAAQSESIIGGTSRFTFLAPTPEQGKTNVDVQTVMSEDIEEIFSDTHILKVRYDPRDRKRASVEVLRRKTTITNYKANDNDVVIIVKTIPNHQPKVHMHYSGVTDSTVVTFDLNPHLKTKADVAHENRLREFIFVVDQSDSMEGTKMERTRSALAYVLESFLPMENTVINVLGFGGSSVKALFERSRPLANDGVLEQALDHVDALEANEYSSDPTAALQRALQENLGNDHDRHVFLLTDGEVIRKAFDILRFVETHRSRGRVYALGVGNRVDVGFVRGLARAGRGTAEFVRKEELVEPALESQIMVALSTPFLSSVRVEWLGVTDSENAQQSPLQLPSLVDGVDFTVRLMIPGRAESLDGVRLYAGWDEVLHYEVVKENFVATTTDEHPSLLHVMTARSLIRELEEERVGENENTSQEQLQEEIVRLGVTYVIASSETSFVTVNERTNQTHTFIVSEGSSNNGGGSDPMIDQADSAEIIPDCRTSLLSNIADEFMRNVYQTFNSWIDFRLFES